MIGFLLEHYAGSFPVWLSPDQVRVIPITDAHNDYALRLVSRMKDLGIRAEADLSNERMNAKIRQAQLFKVPYMLVVGEREVAEETVSLRKRDGKRQDAMPVDEFIYLASDRIKNRSQDL
jgi:threonyl-tRNA synthetase